MGVVTYFLFNKLMVYYMHKMILTFLLRQSICCQPFFDIKDLGEASYVLGIKILHYRSSGMMLKLS